MFTGTVTIFISRQRAEETRLEKLNANKPGVSLPVTPGFAVSEPTAGPIHTPRFVMLDQVVKNLLRRQAIMPKDVNERVADAE